VPDAGGLARTKDPVEAPFERIFSFEGKLFNLKQILRRYLRALSTDVSLRMTVLMGANVNAAFANLSLRILREIFS
jgi:hypothetical protein